jgi:hypothetical protein
MSDWGWVAFAYTVTFGSMAAYAWWTAARLRGARRRLEEWQ